MYWFALWALLGADETTNAESLRFFETRVRPVLVEHCTKCHGDKKQWGGLRVDGREALLRGGDSGPAIVPFRPAESLLIKAVRQTDDELRMPQGGQLSEVQIADLERWIAAGAVFPATPPPAPLRDQPHWAFQPVRAGRPPDVAWGDWPRSPVDLFILEKQRLAGIAPAPAADRGMLLRRLAFDLTGLPPSPDDVRESEADDRPDALVRWIDRFLASPAYGERWGRHWLDVARYADSNGLDENIAQGNAWRYRDYVVTAFNRDKPFDRFVVEQLAGDLLAAPDEATRYEQLIATGFLSIGPKVLAEVDQAKMRMDIVDEQIETTGRAFLGMTLGCARCHDHKFDPISTADYYGLAGIFKSTRSMETYTKVARWHEHPLPSPAATRLKAEYDAKLAARKQEIADFTAQADARARQGLAADAKPPEKLETLYSDADREMLKKLREQLAAVEKDPPDLPAAMGVTEDAIADVAIHVRGNPLKLGDVVPRHTPPVMRGPAPPTFTPQQSGRLELARWVTDPAHPLTARVFVNRVWRWHLGRGLVPTSDNFGLLGERPTHPELLDFLAQRLIDGGWSLKQLQRELLTSSVYAQASTVSAESLGRDPDNRWFSRAQRRRLDAEEVRDAWLAVSGHLDRTFGGSLLKVKNRGYLFDHTSIDLTDYTSYRRSLYLPVIRNNVYDLFQLLDFADPAVSTGDRASTTVAPQALLLMNSDLVMQAADQLAAQVLAARTAGADPWETLYLRVYGRRPTARELTENRQFLAAGERALSPRPSTPAEGELRAWGLLCHALLASNEFLYVP
ncbi:MAG: DUF1553 domain-containing protein [Pirellulales bacterium]